MCRLFYLQILSHKDYEALALGQQTYFEEINGRRGEVFFKNSKETKGQAGGEEVKSLAINKDKQLAFAVPYKVNDKEGFAKIVGEIIKEPQASILEKLQESDVYAVIKKDISEEEFEVLKKADLAGLSFESLSARYYPQELLASQVIGFWGGDGTGQYGIEGYYDDILGGETGIVEQKKGLDLLNVDLYQSRNLNGSDIFLTIDYNIQFQAEELLRQVNQTLDMESGQIVVLKPDSGRILALANFPAFDPNQYSKVSGYDVFQNGAVQKIFEPGSIFKPFTMAMALEEKKVTPESSFFDEGFVKIGPDTIYNFNRKDYGHSTMSQILENSINTGAVHLSSLISRETFFNYVNKFGFNQKTGVDLQGEISSKNEILRKSPQVGYATAAFGQGIEMTPLQLASAFAMFANGGKVVKPYAVESIKGVEEIIPHEVKTTQVISQQTASQVNAMLINVVERGFGDGAKIDGYYLAGKTGTAEVPMRDRKGYYEDRTIQSFVGYGPALNPEFLILVKLDNPKVPKSSLSAVPVFKKLAQYIINYWQIPPDY